MLRIVLDGSGHFLGYSTSPACMKLTINFFFITTHNSPHPQFCMYAQFVVTFCSRQEGTLLRSKTPRNLGGARAAFCTIDKVTFLYSICMPFLSSDRAQVFTNCLSNCYVRCEMCWLTGALAVSCWVLLRCQNVDLHNLPLTPQFSCSMRGSISISVLLPLITNTI